jgi:hypothetical protein
MLLLLLLLCSSVRLARMQTTIRPGWIVTLKILGYPATGGKQDSLRRCRRRTRRSYTVALCDRIFAVSGHNCGNRSFPRLTSLFFEESEDLELEDLGCYRSSEHSRDDAVSESSVVGRVRGLMVAKLQLQGRSSWRCISSFVQI